jgi:6-pyruvoyltetrahydropterin/6-carboxytetrahydropterin synthase
MRIGKTFTFDAAHRLQSHDGKCKNLHGHTYQVEVIVGTRPEDGLFKEGPQEGMVLDFGELSRWWKPLEITLDHRVILEADDPLNEALAGLTPITNFNWPPTAENLALWIQDDLVSWLNKDAVNSHDRQYYAEVRVYETTKSWAEAS